MRPELLRREGRQAYERLRNYLVIAVQAGVAAGLSWFIANDVLHHSQALFAPAPRSARSRRPMATGSDERWSSSPAWSWGC